MLSFVVSGLYTMLILHILIIGQTNHAPIGPLHQHVQNKHNTFVCSLQRRMVLKYWSPHSLRPVTVLAWVISLCMDNQALPLSVTSPNEG
jgi:hypothetical protein